VDTITPIPVVRSLQSAFRLFLIDLQALPEEAFAQSLGGKARTVADIVHEVNLVNDHIGLAIRGEESFDWPEGWIVAPEDRRTKAAAIEAFERSSGRILATVEAFSGDEMEAKVEMEDGETTRDERCRFMTLHAWYHLGQLNFAQTLLGDDGWHWV